MRIPSRILWATIAGVAAIVITAAGSSAIPVASAQAPGGAPQQRGGRGGPWGGPLPMLQQLNLTDAQRQQIHGIVQERSPDQSAGSKLRDLEHQLTVATFAETPDTSQIEQLKASVTEAQAAALAERVDTQLRIAQQVLTPEQRQKVRELPPPGPGRGRGRM